jgi:hypothetical protein
MTPMLTNPSAKAYSFGQLNSHRVEMSFSKEHMTSDAGLLLISEIDKLYKISEQLTACFRDYREPGRVEHQLNDLIAQRLYGIVQGYADLNDHEELRHDRLFGTAIGKLESSHARCAALAGKSTLNRLEQAIHVDLDLSQTRYIKFSVNPVAVEELFVKLFLEQTEKVPKRIILDMDVTDDEVHGTQEEAGFNGYYAHTCYTPLLIFCGRHLLAAKLRPGNIDPAGEALNQLKKIIPQIRKKWPKVIILVRGDSAYSREDIMSWCEGQKKVEYVLAHASNERLRKMTWALEERAKKAYEQQRQEIADGLMILVPDVLKEELDKIVPAQVFYQSLEYITEDSWSCIRRMVCKITYDGKGVRRHFLVTSYTIKQVSPRKLHVEYYCPRGEMENRIKEHQAGLFSDRTSTHEFESNQLRLWFSSLAYILMEAMRGKLLNGTELADAQCGTIRLKLLKISAQITILARKISIKPSEHWSGCLLFEYAWQKLQLISGG